MHDFSTLVIDGDQDILFIFGGEVHIGGSSVLLNEVFRYYNSTWAQQAPLSRPMAFHQTIIIDNLIVHYRVVEQDWRATQFQ